MDLLLLLFLQVLRLLLLVFALAFFRIAEVLEGCCDSISAGAILCRDQTLFNTSTSTDEKFALKEQQQDEPGEPATCHEALADHSKGTVMMSREPNTTSEEPQTAILFLIATLENTSQAKQSEPHSLPPFNVDEQLYDTQKSTNVFRPSSTFEQLSTAVDDPPPRLKYNPSGTCPSFEVESSVLDRSSCSARSMGCFIPKSDLRYKFPWREGSAAKLESVERTLTWLRPSSNKSPLESPLSDKSSHAAFVMHALASRAASPRSEISTTTSDGASLSGGEDTFGGIRESDQQMSKVDLLQPFIPKTPDSHDKHQKPDYLRPHDTPGKDSGYVSSSDSAFSPPNTASRSDAMATPEIRISRPSEQPNRELLNELLNMKEQRRIWKMLLYYHPKWLVNGISLERFITEPGYGKYSHVQILVLDRQEAKHIPLSRALSSRNLRARTGLCLALYDTERRKFVTQLEKALEQGTPLERIEATIHIWNRETSLFENLADMLLRPDWRSTTGLRIQHCSTRRYTVPRSGDLLSWPKFVRATDIVDYYLSALYKRGVNIDSHVDCSLGYNSDEFADLHEAFGEDCAEAQPFVKGPT